MANTISVMANVLRNVVSKQRIRYKENGFNLDLAYICANIIAMGYPADNIESIFRNRLEDVYKFLEDSHGGHYKIYNLCLERSYDINKFHGRVAVYPFVDHNPPAIELILEFCRDVDAWLKANVANVAAVHCKAGKGRTGTMICCYLLYSGQQSTAEDALSCYDEKRTKDRKGVTIPSQRRYVQYFSQLTQSGLTYEKRTLQLCEIRFTEASLLQSPGTVHCSISELQDTSCAAKVQQLLNVPIDFRKSHTLVMHSPPLLVAGDVKVELTHKAKKIFHFWFNTYFVDIFADVEGDGEDAKYVYTLNKSEIDDAHKDKEHKCFSEDFKVQLIFYKGNVNSREQQTSVGSSNRVSSGYYRSSQGGGTCLPTQNSNYALPQNNSSSSDLNYTCDQKSSSSTSVSSMGIGGGVVGHEAARAQHNNIATASVGREGGASRPAQAAAYANAANNSNSMRTANAPPLPLSPPPSLAGHLNDAVQSNAKCNNLPATHHQQPPPQYGKPAVFSNQLQQPEYAVVGQQRQQQYQTSTNNANGARQRQQQQPQPQQPGNRDGNSNAANTKAQNKSGCSNATATNPMHHACNSSKSSSISSHSSSATGGEHDEDDEEEEDWESANAHENFLKAVSLTAATKNETPLAAIQPNMAASKRQCGDRNAVAPEMQHKSCASHKQRNGNSNGNGNASVDTLKKCQASAPAVAQHNQRRQQQRNTAAHQAPVSENATKMLQREKMPSSAAAANNVDEMMHLRQQQSNLPTHASANGGPKAPPPVISNNLMKTRPRRETT